MPLCRSRPRYSFSSQFPFWHLLLFGWLARHHPLSLPLSPFVLRALQHVHELPVPSISPPCIGPQVQLSSLRALFLCFMVVSMRPCQPCLPFSLRSSQPPICLASVLLPCCPLLFICPCRCAASHFTPLLRLTCCCCSPRHHPVCLSLNSWGACGALGRGCIMLLETLRLVIRLL